MVTDQTLRDKIVAQSLREILWDRRYKQGKVKNWQKNEQMYYAVKITTSESRANVDLGRMQEFVHTLLSKIRRPLIFKYTKRKESQLRRVKLLNAVREVDRKNDNWDIKDLVAKKQGVVYGRAVFCYYADSIDGYKSHLENVDVYDFLIDPAGGGIDIEQAKHMGNYGVVFMRDELEAGVKSGDFLKAETNEILDGIGNNTEVNQEETNKLTRMFGQNTIGKKELQNEDKFRFWRWVTTFEGERYYLVLQEKAGRAIRVEKLTDMTSPTKQFPKGAWPFWSWAAFPDLTEFWTPSYCDYVREIFMAQNVSIDQMLDNAEAVNKPMKKVNVNAIENMAELKYRKDGIIKVKGDFDVDKAFQTVLTPSIDTPLKVFDQLEKIQEKASGVNSDVKGASDPDGKVAIYEGNKAAIADRFGLLDISYSFGYTRFARLHEIGVRDNLTKKIAVEMIGPDGIEVVEASRRDIFKKGDEFGVTVESSSDDMMVAAAEKEMKLNFIQKWIDSQNARLAQSPTAQLYVNPQKAFEMQGKIMGLKPEEIKELLDVQNYGTDDILSEAEEDIESLLNGDEIKPNPAANNAYLQRFVDWLTNHEEDMDDKTFQTFTDYMTNLQPIIIKNEARAVNTHAVNTMNNLQPGAQPPPPGGILGGGPPPGAPAPNPTAPAPAIMPPAPAQPNPLPLPINKRK
jgi:hypothetical protein